MFAAALNKGSRGAIAGLTGLFLVAIILDLFSPHDIENNNYPDLFYNYFVQKITHAWLLVLLSYLFIIIGAILVSFIAVNQEIVDKQNYFPVFIYLLLSIASVQPHQLVPQILTNVFILFSIFRLLDTYRKEDVLNHIYEAAFALSFSAFISISVIPCFLLFFIILLILRPFYWREWLVAFLGFLSPVFLYECVAYLSDFNQWYFLKATQNFFSYLKMPSFSEYYLPLLFLLLLLLLVSVIWGFISGFGNTVKKQRAKSILLWYLLFASSGFFSGSASSSGVILTFALPLSFFMGDFLFSLKQIKITNTILFIMILCVALVFLAQFNVV